MHIGNWFKKLWKAEEGVAYIEFALSLPVLMLMLMGSIEVTRYVLISQKVEKASLTVSDLVSQSATIGTTQLNQLVIAAGEIMQPYSFSTQGFVVVSCVGKTGTAAPRVTWQYTGGGSWTHASQIGVSGGVATLPSGFTMNDRDTVIIAEVYYRYTPIILGNGAIGTKDLYKIAIFKPRLGTLNTLGS